MLIPIEFALRSIIPAGPNTGYAWVIKSQNLDLKSLRESALKAPVTELETGPGYHLAAVARAKHLLISRSIIGEKDSFSRPIYHTQYVQAERGFNVQAGINKLLEKESIIDPHAQGDLTDEALDLPKVFAPMRLPARPAELMLPVHSGLKLHIFNDNEEDVRLGFLRWCQHLPQGDHLSLLVYPSKATRHPVKGHTLVTLEQFNTMSYEFKSVSTERQQATPQGPDKLKLPSVAAPASNGNGAAETKTPVRLQRINAAMPHYSRRVEAYLSSLGNDAQPDSTLHSGVFGLSERLLKDLTHEIEGRGDHRDSPDLACFQILMRYHLTVMENAERDAFREWAKNMMAPDFLSSMQKVVQFSKRVALVSGSDKSLHGFISSYCKDVCGVCIEEELQ